MRRESLRASLLPFLGLALLAAVAASPAGAQYATTGNFGKNKIQYRDFDWTIYHSPHFDVYYYTESEALLQKVVSFAESAYDLLARDFDFQIKEPTPLIFYETHSAFEQNNIILNFIPEGVGAFASPVRNRMVLPVDLPDPELMELILHELTHIFQYHILFGGSLGKGLASAPPTWVMEGMASYMARDESARDRMFLRDAVVNDQIPSVGSDFGGFFAYRFGHAVFDFMEERWGKEGFRDFIIELRNTLGARVDRAVKRTFQMEAEDFDAEFRRWLRQKYLTQLVETGEPSDFGRPFRIEEGRSQELSPAAAPSGDLVAAFSTQHGDVDIVLFDTKERSTLRNLTKSYTKDFQYFVAQELTLGREMGRDLAFSPDGNTLAAFAKRERGRSLVLIDVLKGKIDEIVDMDIEQQLSPAWSPDGREIAFSGWRDGQVDIFLIDRETKEIRNLTDDPIYDGSPAFAPDGGSLVITSVVGGFGKLFRVELDQPGDRFQLTEGESNEVDAVFSADGARVYYTSDSSGANNIHSLDLATGRILQHTDAVTGCFQPAVLRSPDGSERLVYTGYWRGRFDLYRLDLDEPVSEPQVVEEGAIPAREPLAVEALPRFEPAIEVTVDPANEEKYGRGKFFLEDIGGGAGISDDQTYIASVYVVFSDYLGDKRIFGSFQSIESFQNFDAAYLDLSDRLQWQARLFDSRDFYTATDVSTGLPRRVRAAYTETGAIGSLIYPFSFYHRFEAGAGYMLREADYPIPGVDPETGLPVLSFLELKDDFPIVLASLVGDTTLFEAWGPVSGRRWRLGANYAPDLDDSGTLTRSYTLDVRQYASLTRRVNFAMRAVGVQSSGNRPSLFYFGGLDTVRGFDFRSLVGNRGFYANLELRFPLIDLLATPVFAFQGIRGFVFLDVGGAWFHPDQEFDFWDSENDRLEDAVSSYGFGVTTRLWGLDLNWSFAKRWNFDETLSDGLETSFWIGPRF